MDLGDLLEQIHSQGIAYDPSSQGLLAQDFSGILVYYDRGAETIFGYARSEAIGMPSANLLPKTSASGEYARQRQALFDRVLATGNPETVPSTQRVTKSGDVITITAVVFRYRLNGGYSIAALVEKVA